MIETDQDAPLHPYAARDLGWLLRKRAHDNPSQVLLMWEPFEGSARCWTYAEFLDQVAAIASGLKKNGVRDGDRILIHMDNSPEMLFSWFASALVGSVAVTTNTRSTRVELEYFLRATGAEIVLTQNRYGSLFEQEAASARRIFVAPDAIDPAPEVLATKGLSSFDELVDHASKLQLLPVDPSRRLSIQFTSGSTSRPKGVVWTHANALWGAQMSAQYQRLAPDDRYLVTLPFFHTNAQAYSVLASIWVGAMIVLQPRFSATRFWPVALKQRCTRTSLVPFCLKALRQQPIPSSHQFRTWGFGVAHPEAERTFGVKFIGWWGMTETIAPAIVSDYLQPSPFLSMGWPSPAYEIRIVNDQGSNVLEGEPGKLIVRGRRGVSLFLEYFGNTDATDRAFDKDGWFDTGDRIRMGDEGILYFVERQSEILKVGGENVSALEIEKVIGAVDGVLEVAVVGRPSKMYDELPVAFVVATKSASPDLVDRVEAACRLALSSFKVPHEIFLVDALPRAALDKIAKGELRRSLSEAP